MFLYHLHAWYPQRPVKLWDPVEPKLQTFMSYYVSTGNWTQVLWKRSLCLECVSHHFNPSELFKYHVLLLSFYLLLLGKKHCLILFQRLSVYCFSWSFFPPVSVRRLHYLLDTVVLFLYLLFSLAEIGLHVWNIFFSTFLVFEGLMKSHSFLCDLQWRPLFWHSLWQLSFVVFVLL